MQARSEKLDTIFQEYNTQGGKSLNVYSQPITEKECNAIIKRLEEAIAEAEARSIPESEKPFKWARDTKAKLIKFKASGLCKPESVPQLKITNTKLKKTEKISKDNTKINVYISFINAYIDLFKELENGSRQDLVTKENEVTINVIKELKKCDGVQKSKDTFAFTFNKFIKKCARENIDLGRFGEGLNAENFLQKLTDLKGLRNEENTSEDEIQYIDKIDNITRPLKEAAVCDSRFKDNPTLIKLSADSQNTEDAFYKLFLHCLSSISSLSKALSSLQLKSVNIKGAKPHSSWSPRSAERKLAEEHKTDRKEFLQASYEQLLIMKACLEVYLLNADVSLEQLGKDLNLDGDLIRLVSQMPPKPNALLDFAKGEKKKIEKRSASEGVITSSPRTIQKRLKEERTKMKLEESDIVDENPKLNRAVSFKISKKEKDKHSSNSSDSENQLTRSRSFSHK